MALTDYEKYIRTEELLALQKAPSALTCHDELQFQVVHQAAELWMKLIEHELGFTCQLLAADDPVRAVTHLGRVARIQRVLLHQLDVLDTMAPIDYMTIRTGLGRGLVGTRALLHELKVDSAPGRGTHVRGFRRVTKR